MKKSLLTRLAVLLLTITMLSSCILVPVPGDGGRRGGGQHDGGRGDHHDGHHDGRGGRR